MIEKLRAKLRDEKGWALITAIFAMSLVLLTLLTALTMTQTTGQMINYRLRYHGQTLNAANAGLVEALDWFRRQPTQPVSTFSPILDMAADPPVNDTDVQTTPPSIVREFEISSLGRVWGRYEVRTGSQATGLGVIDLTGNRGRTGVGRVWQIESEGIVYVQNDGGVAFDTAPNRILGRRTVRSEIQRLAINLPANAAIIARTASRVDLNQRVRVAGSTNGAGVAYPSGTGSMPAMHSTTELSGTPAQTAGVSTGAFSIESVFGITYQELLSIADIVVTDPADLPIDTSLSPADQSLGSKMQIIVLDNGAGNTATFDSSRALRGAGVLVVTGNLSVNDFTSWSGLIYVVGDYTQTSPPSAVSGAIIAASTGSDVSITGGSSDFTELLYDRFIINQVAVQLGQYRFSRSAYIP